MEPGKYYHIYTHANGSEDFFRSDENYAYFLKRYIDFIEPIANTYAYCLMSNHIHFLVGVKAENQLEEVWKVKYYAFADKIAKGCDNYENFVVKQFSHLFNAYTQAFNKMYKRRGSLFMHSFKRKEIIHDNYLTNAILYIHVNPIHHGFVKTLDAWRWSSYQDILSNEETFVERAEVLQWFGNRDQYVRMHEEKCSS